MFESKQTIISIRPSLDPYIFFSVKFSRQEERKPSAVGEAAMSEGKALACLLAQRKEIMIEFNRVKCVEGCEVRYFVIQKQIGAKLPS